MSRILISGLVNIETTVKVRRFPIEYYPIDYPFFGVDSGASGVAYNIAVGAAALGDEVRLTSLTGKDFQAEYVRNQLAGHGISPEQVLPLLQKTPCSVVLYDDTGRRQIYCDLKDIQQASYPFDDQLLEDVDIVAACNISFNRPLLARAKAAGKIVATDVHVLSDLRDEYNRDFLEAADILFLSDEDTGENYRSFIRELAQTYSPSVIVMGRGSKGAAITFGGDILEVPTAKVGSIVNTVGAGDALFTGFIHYYAKGLEPVEALIRAELFASAKIAVSGGAKGFVSEDEIERLYALHADTIKTQIR